MTIMTIGKDGRYHHDADRFPYVVSLDCHDRSHFIKIVHVPMKRTLFNHNILGSLDNVDRAIDRCRIPKKKVLIIYEAGGLGFYPYRYFSKKGYSCLIIAPSSIPTNNRRRKTDKKDCGSNLDFHLSGILKYVVAPNENDEDSRDCIRYRRKLAWRITQQQQRILGFTKRHGFLFDLTKSNWTIRHRTWLKGISLSLPLRTVLDLMLDELDMLERQMQKVEKSLEIMVNASPQYRDEVAAYQLLPGVGPITAMTVAFECRDLNRFAQASAVPCFFGLIPSKCASGTSDPDMSITKEGNGFMRLALVGASKAYGDRRMLYSEKELAALPAVVQPFMRKLQNRLYTRYRYLKSKGKHTNKVRCAIARELAMFLWEYRVKIMPELELNTSFKMAA